MRLSLGIRMRLLDCCEYCKFFCYVDIRDPREEFEFCIPLRVSWKGLHNFFLVSLSSGATRARLARILIVDHWERTGTTSSNIFTPIRYLHAPRARGCAQEADSVLSNISAPTHRTMYRLWILLMADNSVADGTLPFASSTT